MQIIDKSHKPDYVLGYYIIFVISLLTLKKINRIERLKVKLKKKKEENSNRNV
jgi:hypothetical protein